MYNLNICEAIELYDENPAWLHMADDERAAEYRALSAKLDFPSNPIALLRGKQPSVNDPRSNISPVVFASMIFPHFPASAWDT